MKTSNGPAQRPRRRIPGLRRTRLLAAFERSGLSAAAFARRYGLHYTTFCGWRQRQAKGQASPNFVQVELPSPATVSGLVVEWDTAVRIRLADASQIALAAQLLQALNAPTSC